MKKNKPLILYRLMKFLFGWFFLFYYNPKIIGKNNLPKKGSIVVACNHKHIMDQCPIILSTSRQINYMAKKEYFDGSFKWFFKSVGCISVNRKEKDPVAVEKAIKVLENGGALGIFPEGTRNKTLGTKDEKILLPFKYGAVSFALKTNSLIVPVAITGEYKFRSKNLKVNIGKPLNINGMEKEEANELLYNTILEMLIKENIN